MASSTATAGAVSFLVVASDLLALRASSAIDQKWVWEWEVGRYELGGGSMDAGGDDRWSTGALGACWRLGAGWVAKGVEYYDGWMEWWEEGFK
jgi:hypothetical protein